MDARERALAPRIHLFRKKPFEDRWIAPEFGLARIPH